MPVRAAWFPCVLTVLLAVGCGLADSERDERNRYEYFTFYDKNFESLCLGQFDLDGNGRISRYEAQRVRDLSCAGAGIASLADLKEFGNVERLDCSGNDLAELDLTLCPRLTRVDCSGNGLLRLDVEDLRSLVWLDCSENALAELDLTSNGSLATLDARGNRFRTLDVSMCSSTLEADVRDNPELGTVYRRATQSLLYDGITTPVER